MAMRNPAVKKRIFTSIILLLLLVAGQSLCGQSFTFHHLGLKEGLSAQDTGPICQDHFGFVWVGTSNGLNRFDGYQFRAYTFVPGDSFSLPTNTIADVFEDSQQRLWVATRGGGLVYYDPVLDQFHPQSHIEGDSSSLDNNYVNQIYEDHQGRLWIGTNGGLNELLSWDHSGK